VCPSGNIPISSDSNDLETDEYLPRVIACENADKLKSLI
jgi:hypothetical protein